MMKFYSADYILPVHAQPIRNGVVAVAPDKSIYRLYEPDHPELAGKPVEQFRGIIVPGFINAHCHLELSHLRGEIPRGQGLVAFISEVRQPKGSERTRLSAMEAADKEMEANGIVAVGDHVNSTVSAAVKRHSNLYYHTFAEIICFEPDKARLKFRESMHICEEFETRRSSVTPHAPYSAVKEVFRYLRALSGDNLISIHNQETEEENEFYRYGKGRFVEFYRELGRNITFFNPRSRSSVQSIGPLLPRENRILFVHNTYTTPKDFNAIERLGRQVTWCFCPNANLYIENRLPRVMQFYYQGLTVALGTDSLASNSKLCILSELKTLHREFPELELAKTIRWATLNGARFLGIDDTCGTLEAGKKPGLNLITNTHGQLLTPESKVRKLV